MPSMGWWVEWVMVRPLLLVSSAQETLASQAPVEYPTIYCVISSPFAIVCMPFEYHYQGAQVCLK